VTGGGRGDVAPQADGLAEGIARLRRALRRGARVADPGNTLAVAQLELLAALAEHPGARPGQLARQLNMRANTVTTIVNALIARGMLERVTADDDRRAVSLTATEAGRQAVLAWQATNAAVLHLALSTLPPRQRRALAAATPALDALARAIDRLADTPGPADTLGPTDTPGLADASRMADTPGPADTPGRTGKPGPTGTPGLTDTPGTPNSAGTPGSDRTAG
jgi:DNA-binding MarR family transcriptional regulator